jgi:hypothetical protein
MQLAVRSSLTAGVAVVAASALLMAPVSPSASPDIQIPAISSAKVEMAALVNPFVLWSEVAANTVGNISGLLNTALANPAPILGQAVSNQLASGRAMFELLGGFGERFLQQLSLTPERLRAAFEEILAGDFATGIPNIPLAFITPFIGAALPLLVPAVTNINAVLQGPFKNVANAIGTVISFNTMLSIGLPLVTEILAPFGQIGLTAQAIFDGVTTGDLEAVANALISFPSDMVNTVLNGNPTFGNAGLLNATTGLFAGLLALRQSVADALTPPVFMPVPPVAPMTLLADQQTASYTASGISSLPDANSLTLTLGTPVDKVVDAPKIEADPVVNVVEAADAPIAEETVTENVVVNEPEAQPAPEPEADPAPLKEKAPDKRPTTKDGNKVVPGKVNTGVTNNGSTNTPATSAEEPEAEAPAGAPDATDNTGGTGSDDGANAGGSGGGDE